MSLTLTTLSSDNFQRANAYPLGGLWVYDYTGADGLEIDSDLANAPVNQPGSPSNLTSGEQGYNYSLPNDHFVSVTLAENALKSGAFIALGVRTDFVTRPFNTDGAYSVNLQLQGGGGNSITWYLYPQEGGAQANRSVTAHVGDVFTLAVVGTTAYVLQNSTILTSATVAGEYDGPGLPYTGMFMSNEGTGDESGFVSLYAVGSASVTSSGGGGGSDSYSPSLAYVGTIRVVSAPDNDSAPNPFIGTFEVLAAAPAGFPNAPYLGHIVEGSAPAGRANPNLGQVFVVASAPAGEPDPFLGTAVKN
jgi:hypothetical protein